MQDIFDLLNQQQKNAVTTCDKNILILAGAGTGKTMAITAKIIYLIKELGLKQENILAVTFTNKASNEMKERVDSYFGKNFDIMIKTFHAFCAYVLRREALLINRNRYFQILDSDDSKAVIKKILKDKKDMTNKRAADYMKLISLYKQNEEKFIYPDYHIDELFLEIYNEYEEYLDKSNCLDFEDLLLKTVRLFESNPDVLNRYRKRFKYILVDEYQDTNRSQFRLLKLLDNSDTMIAVVGDEDQSIYKFRGADINNILNFQNEFNNVEIIRLELNYRSTNKILNIANAVIQNNKNRVGKNLFSIGKNDGKIVLFEAQNEIEEADIVVRTIKDWELKLGDTAILYRTNNQSRAFEQILTKFNIPFVVLGAVAFYQREEIKDALAILRWIINKNDRVSFLRFVNKPSRGIGEKSIKELFELSGNYNNDIFETLKHLDEYPNISKNARIGLLEIYNIFKNGFDIKALTVDQVLNYYLEKLGLFDYYKEVDLKDGTEKLENLKELLLSVKSIGATESEILTYLETTSLVPSKDDDSNLKDRLKLLTVHNAKGLEFENVFIVGMEDGLFPSIKDDDNCSPEEKEEEERRLFYVAITRAKLNLFISYCKSRNLYGESMIRSPSRFLAEIPEYLVDAGINKTGSLYERFTDGDIVKHPSYGKGKIVKIEIREGKRVALIDFWDYGFCEIFIDKKRVLEKV